MYVQLRQFKVYIFLNGRRQPLQNYSTKCLKNDLRPRLPRNSHLSRCRREHRLRRRSRLAPLDLLAGRGGADGLRDVLGVAKWLSGVPTVISLRI